MKAAPKQKLSATFRVLLFCDRGIRSGTERPDLRAYMHALLIHFPQLPPRSLPLGLASHLILIPIPFTAALTPKPSLLQYPFFFFFFFWSHRTIAPRDPLMCPPELFQRKTRVEFRLARERFILNLLFPFCPMPVSSDARTLQSLCVRPYPFERCEALSHTKRSLAIISSTASRLCDAALL